MLLKKLQALGIAASWDSCGGVKHKSFRKAGIPAGFSYFVHDCSGTSEDCRLMKVLQSNKCVHDCKYCFNSSHGGMKTELSPAELAKSFSSLASKGFVQGLFLSSAVTGNAERSAEQIIESARILREKFCFRGYIHLKVLPETPRWQIFDMARYADRLSLNIEVPSKQHLHELSSTKDYYNDLEKRLLWIDKAKRKGLLRSFTTQLILGASDETDFEVLEKMSWLYENTALHRTYFSAFSPVKNTPLENKTAENAAREHTLYQIDWLLRIYGFQRDEIELALQHNGNFSYAIDPKIAIALNNPNQFPVDVNCASEKELLKVPGIGPRTARKIIEMREKRKFHSIKQLKEAGVITKRAQSFIWLDGSMQRRITEW